MKTIINKTADQITDNMNHHLNLIRKFGGKKINSVSIATCAGDNWGAWDEDTAARTTIRNARLIKNLREFRLCNFGGGHECLFSIPLSTIAKYMNEINDKTIKIRLIDTGSSLGITGGSILNEIVLEMA